MDFHFTGLVAAPFTPMKENGDVDLSKVEKYAQHLSRSKVKGVFVNGTTGEGILSVSVEERKAILEEWVKQGQDLVPTIMAQVGGCSFGDAKDLASHAEALHVAAIGCLPSLFPRPNNIEDLVLWCKKIAESAPNTPFFYYHIPSFTGVNLSMTEFLLEAQDKIPTLAGVKYSSADFGELASILSLKRSNGNSFKIFHGNDETLASAVALGVDSAVGSTYNFMPHVFQKLLELQEQGKKEDARNLQEQITNMFKTIFSFGFAIGALKPVMKIITGLDLGPPRFPYKILSIAEEKRLRSMLMNNGLDLLN